MPQFIVPQFIDVEDKIIGPITTRQFAMGTLAGLLIFFSYKFADTALFVVEALLVFGIYVLVAFIKINGQRFPIFALSIIRSLLRSPLRVWSKISIPKASTSAKATADKKVTIMPAHKVHPQSQALSSLSLLVDTGGKYKTEEVLKKKNKK